VSANKKQQALQKIRPAKETDILRDNKETRSQPTVCDLKPDSLPERVGNDEIEGISAGSEVGKSVS
jgi:hypothetical protein